MQAAYPINVGLISPINLYFYFRVNIYTAGVVAPLLHRNGKECKSYVFFYYDAATPVIYSIALIKYDVEWFAWLIRHILDTIE